MNEQTRIPVPQDAAPEAAAASEGKSLIERAVSALDLARVAPPPIPEGLIQPRSRMVGARQSATAGKQPQAEPAAREMPSPAPVSATPQPVEVPAPAAMAPQPVVEPVRFAAARHPIDREVLREKGMILPEGNVTELLEEFRIVKRQLLANAADLRRQGVGEAAQRILVSSPHPNEGKTWCAVNLALSVAAEKESDVLLVDADFAKPSILGTLGLPGGPGLMDALRDPAIDVADLVIGTDVPGLWVLPAGNATNSDSEYLSSSRTAAVLQRLTEGAPQRMVIFDSPPALAASPAAELAKYVGQTVVVVRADKTGQGALEDAISLLSACPNIQLLLNAASFSPSGRRFGAYYGYGG